MKIREVLFSKGQSAYFHVDFAAIRAGREEDGFIYRGEVMTPNFNSIVEPAEIISVILVLDDGQTAFGDCTDVVYSGASGRDPIFLPADHLDLLRGEMSDLLSGREVELFRPAAVEFDEHRSHGVRLHVAIRYGITQALLHAVSLYKRATMAEIIAAEYDIPLPSTSVPILSTGELDDPKQLDRMILKGVELLPHAYYQSTRQMLGIGAEHLFAYVGFVARRILAIGGRHYRPRIVVDMGGTLGDLFENNLDTIVGCIGRAAAAAAPFDLLIETPLIGTSRDQHLELLADLRRRLKTSGVAVPIIADEWCNTFEDIKALIAAEASDFVQIKMPDLGGINNTIEAVLYCKAHGMGAFLGGSYNETDQSARVSTHVALVTKPDFMVAKPGRGGDEAIMIQRNEMARTLALLERHRITRGVASGT